MNWLKYNAIFVYSEPIDFRKQMNGLIAEVLSSKKEPNDGSLYLFRNRQSNRVKMITWDRNGYLLGYKRLAKGQFDFPVTKEGVILLKKEELFNLISGMPMVRFQSIKKPVFHH
tara:strand:- start:214 stop:555 length:342 start_codon:yes stop_codon:yes gene_type:complete